MTTRQDALRRQRASDLDLLDRLLDAHLPDYERDAFEKMKRELDSYGLPGVGYATLSEPRRGWCNEVATRVGAIGYVNLASSGELVRGREVATPEVLRNLPKKPPGRR